MENIVATAIVYAISILIFLVAWKLTGWAMKWRNDPRNKP